MKTTLMYGFVLGMATLLSAPLYAKCDQEAEEQTIKVIKAASGGYTIENKQENKKCMMKNNQKLDDKSSLFKVDFSAVDCSDGCKVIFKRIDEEPDDGGVDDGKPNFKRARVCKVNAANQVTTCDIRVNHLKNFCYGTSDEYAKGTCHVRYVLKIGREKVDPIIVIKPLPTQPE